jgi:hypothetical protein
MDFLKLLNTLSTIDNKTKLVEGKEPSPWKPAAAKSSSMFKPWVAESEEAMCKGCKKPESKCACEEEKVEESADKLKEAKCNECGMYESKCSCDKDEIEEMMQLAGRPVKEAKKVKEDEVEEGNAFSKAVVDAKKDGVQPGEKITVGGKKYPVKENTSADLMKRWADIFETEDDKLAKKDYDDDGKLETGKEEHAGSVDNAIKKSQGKDDKETVEENTGKFDKKDTKWTDKSGKEHPAQRVTRKTGDLEQGKEDGRRGARTMPDKKGNPLGESMEEIMPGADSGMEDNFSINSSMDSSGHKSVSISATGSKADELTQILKNAGLGIMGGGEEEHAELGHDDMDHGDMGSEGDVEVVSIPLAHQDGYQAPEHEGEVDEAAKYRNPKYKDQLYTQEPLDHTFGPDMDAAYDNDYPDDYAGRKSPMDSGNGDPLKKGHRMSADNSINTRGNRKGLPSRDQISSLKNSIKDAHGTHTRPNLPEEAEEQYSNEPHTQVQSVSSQMHQGNDLNAEKRSHKHSYRQGDNPMAMEDQQAAARLEKELMEELSSLKVVSEKYAGFSKTVGALKKQGGVKDPEALAASIGRKKYGKDKFQNAAAKGKKLG